MPIVAFGEVQGGMNHPRLTDQIVEPGRLDDTVLQIIERSATARLVKRMVWAILPAPIL